MRALRRLAPSRWRSDGGRAEPVQAMRRVRVSVESSTGEVMSGEVDSHQLLLRASRKVGVKIENLCANRGLCMTCAVIVSPDTAGGLSAAASVERRYLDWVGAPGDVRLSCQAEVVGDVEIRANLIPIDRWDHDPTLPWWQDLQHDPPLHDR